jgi:hypothetical protein
MGSSFLLGVIFGLLLGLKASKALIKYGETKYGKRDEK